MGTIRERGGGEEGPPPEAIPPDPYRIRAVIIGQWLITKDYPFHPEADQV